MKYTINIECLHNNQMPAVKIYASNWIQLIWRSWRVYKMIRNTYDTPTRTIEVVNDELLQRAVVGYKDQLNRFVPLVAVKATD